MWTSHDDRHGQLPDRRRRRRPSQSRSTATCWMRPTRPSSSSCPIRSTASSPAIGVATIDDDDGPNISIANVTVPEGDSGSALRRHGHALRGEPAGRDRGRRSADGTAIAGDDYESIAAGALTIPAGPPRAPSGRDQRRHRRRGRRDLLRRPLQCRRRLVRDNQAVVTIDDDDGVGGARLAALDRRRHCHRGRLGNDGGDLHGHAHASDRCGHGRLLDRRRDRVAGPTSRPSPAL